MSDDDKSKVDFTKGTPDKYRYYPDRPAEREHRDSFIAKGPSKFYDPCAESSKMAVRCMERHDHDYKEVCSEYFQAYRECKKEWLEARRQARNKGGIW